MSGPISVVIPAKDSATTIADQLQALVQQPWPHGGEIIVADNGSIDLTSEIASSFDSPELPVIVLPCAELTGAGYARNCGAQQARFDKLGFCDSDDVVGARWIEQIGRALDRADAVGGYIEVDLLNTEAAARSRGTWNVDRLPLLDGDVPVLSSCNFGITAQVFDQLGGFSTDVEPAEDCELSVRLHQAGITSMFAAEAVVHYRMRSTLRDIFVQAYRWGTKDPTILRRLDPHSPSLSPTKILRSWLWVVRTPYLVVNEVGRYRVAHTLGRRLGFLRGLFA